MTNYAKGVRNERKTIDLLDSCGYTCTRAAGSHGLWDVIAIHPSHVRLIQVKSNGWPGAVEMEQMEAFGVPLFISREVWRWNDREKKPLTRVLKSDTPLGGWAAQPRFTEWLNNLKGGD